MSNFVDLLKKYSFLPEWFSIVGVFVVLITASSYISAVNERTLENRKKIEDNSRDIKEVRRTQTDMLETLGRIDERTKIILIQTQVEDDGK